MLGAGFDCPTLLMTSGGGLTTVTNAMKFPIRLVESGPAGGAVFASSLARQMGLTKVVSFDMGGTTAKICLLEDGQVYSPHHPFETGCSPLSYSSNPGVKRRIPQGFAQPSTAREFEVDRSARFAKGSGLPLRIPVVEMVEIGAGGGSLATVDSLGRVRVGPQVTPSMMAICP